MAEPSANLRVRISADLADIRQGLGMLTRQLREVRSEAGRPLPAKNPIGDLGISAGQTAQAMRQLPAQFTDIFTSLQGGMPFFTVLVQQGGQIKDSFGGVAPALKGVSSAVIGMINPSWLSPWLRLASPPTRGPRSPTSSRRPWRRRATVRA